MKMQSYLNREVSSDQSGLSLLETTLSLSLFAVVILASGETLLRGVEHGETSFDNFQLMTVVDNKIAEMQNYANLPNNYVTQEGIGSIYGRYNGVWESIGELNLGYIYTRCYGNETTVPTILGGPQDLNYDNDAEDNLDSAAGGVDLKLVPVYIFAYYVEDGNVQSLWTYRLITKTTE